MGQVQNISPETLSPRLLALAAASPEAGAAALRQFQQRPRHPEGFDRRQPEHIVLAGLLGLGKFDARDIDHRVIQL